MIKISDNTLIINDTHLSFPIRIKQVIEFEKHVIVCIAYDYALDVGIEWNKGGKELWHEINTTFKEPTLFCFDKLGNLKWKFDLNGFFNISKLDNNEIDNDLRIKSWIQSNHDKPNVFIVNGDDKLLVDFKTGEIYDRLEMR